MCLSSGRERKLKVIPVYSGKGGTGKSCVSAYTAAALAAQKKKTLLIDAGKAPGTLDVILGVQNAVYNLGDILSGACDFHTAVLELSDRENLSLIPAGFSGGGGQRTLAELLYELRYDYDYAVIDDPGAELCGGCKVDCALLVTTPDALSARYASQKCRELYEHGANNVRLVVNNVPARVVPMKSFKDFDELIDQIGAQLIAVIPASQRLHHSANNGLPLSRESILPDIFTRLAERIRGKHAPLLIK
jgi:septum formation inhibitor-activating ATPase MinD